MNNMETDKLEYIQIDVIQNRDGGYTTRVKQWDRRGHGTLIDMFESTTPFPTRRDALEWAATHI